MTIIEALKKLRDDIKTWATNNFRNVLTKQKATDDKVATMDSEIDTIQSDITSIESKTDNIEASENDSIFSITDNSGHIVAQIDSSGLVVTEVKATKATVYDESSKQYEAVMTPTAVDNRINSVIATASDTESITNLTSLVDYLDKHGTEAAEMLASIENLEKNKANKADLTNSMSNSAGKTVASLTQTDGVINATFQDISITENQISDLKHSTVSNGDNVTVTESNRNYTVELNDEITLTKVNADTVTTDVLETPTVLQDGDTFAVQDPNGHTIAQIDESGLSTTAVYVNNAEYNSGVSLGVGFGSWDEEGTILIKNNSSKVIITGAGKIDWTASDNHNYVIDLPTDNGTFALLEDLPGLVGAKDTTGLVKNGSTVTSTSGLTACPIISGIPYYKDTNTQAAYGNITTSGTITSTVVASATGVLVYDSNNKIQRATAANARDIIGALATATATTAKKYIIGVTGDASNSTYYNTNISFQDGKITASSFYASSDRRLKENIIDANLNYSEILNNIKLKEFTWKSDEEKKPYLGVIAQEIKKALPEKYQYEFVGGEETDTEYLSVNDSKLVYILIGALQEQAKEIKELKEIINKKQS